MDVIKIAGRSSLFAFGQLLQNMPHGPSMRQLSVYIDIVVLYKGGYDVPAMEQKESTEDLCRVRV